MALKDNNDDWLHNKDLLPHHIIDFFKSLYLLGGNMSFVYYTHSNFSIVIYTDLANIQDFWTDLMDPNKLCMFFSIEFDNLLDLNISSNTIGINITIWQQKKIYV